MTLLADLAAPAPALRLRPIPVAEPRAALGVLPPADPAAPAGQAALPFEPVGRRPSRAPAPGARGARSDDGMPEPREWALQFTRVALEVAAGLRPPAQLLRWATPGVLAALSRRHALAQRSGGRPARAVVRTLRLCEPAPSVCEVAAVVGEGPRVRALALRLEGEGERWRVTAFELG